jgi:glycerophosphoryl diester phosphodiesterase
MPLVIEVKAIHAQWPLRRILERFNVAERSIVASFERAALDAFTDPPFARGASRRDVLELMARTVAGLSPGRVHYRAICAPNLYYGVPIPVGPIITGARRLGAPVHFWTVDDAREARRLWQRGASGIISNAPGKILEERKSLRQ